MVAGTALPCKKPGRGEGGLTDGLNRSVPHTIDTEKVFLVCVYSHITGIQTTHTHRVHTYAPFKDVSNNYSRITRPITIILRILKSSLVLYSPQVV